jgi:dihydroflavonol-4-reductase
MAATVLITGVSGFIARHCAVEMLNAGYRVRGTLRSLQRSDGVRESLARHVDVTRLEFAEADLGADRGWDEAVAGVQAVLHLASPFPVSQPRDEQELIRPAVDGSLRALRAAARAGVSRFVQTSSMVAVMYGHAHDRATPFTAADWTRVESAGVTGYAKSKTLAERAAREFVERERPSMHYSSVNPGVVFGPALDPDIGTSAEIVQAFLKGKYPGAPRLSIPIVDVRDVARMHRLAVETGSPSGGRYLAVADCLWLIEVARALRESLGPAARKVPTRVLPDWAVKLVSVFDPMARQAVPDLGKQFRVDTGPTRQALGLTFIPAGEAAAAMGRSLVELGLA